MGKKKYLAVKPLSPDHAKRLAPLPSFPPSNPSSPVRENRPIVSPPPQHVAQPASSGVSPPKSAHRTEEDGAAVANSQRPRPAALQPVDGPPRGAALPAPAPLVRTPHLQKPLVHSALAPHQHHAHAPPAAGAQPAQAGRPSAFDAAVKPHHPHAQPLRQHVPAVVDGQVIGQPHHAHDQHHAHGQAHMHPTHAHHQPHGTGHVPHSAMKTAAPLPPQAAPLPAPAASPRAPSPQAAARAQTTSPTPRPIYESHVEAPSRPAPAATSVPPTASPRPAQGGPVAAASAPTTGAGAAKSAAEEKLLKAKQKKLKALASEASSGGSSGKNGKRKQGLMARLFCARPKTFDEKHGGAADYVKIEQYEAKNPHAKPSPQAAANASQTARTATPQTQTMSDKPPPPQQPRQQQPPQQQQQQQPRQHMSATQQWLMQQQQQIHQLAQQQQQQPPRHYPAPGYPPASSHGYPQPQQHHPLQPTPLGAQQQQPQPQRPVPYHVAVLQQGAPKERFAVV
jgi:hypothetical protein